MEIIAEVGSTWRLPDMAASHDLALASIGQAARAGASAIKYQVFRADSLYSKERAPELYERTKRYELPLEWLPELKTEAQKHGIGLWTSIFAVDLIEPALPYLDGLKVASGDLTNRPLLEAMAKAAAEAELPLAISTGAATPTEINDLYIYLRQFSAPRRLILMHCVSEYPALEWHMNLRAISYLRDRADEVGLSDHTGAHSNLVAQLALALGATVFEKHFAPDGADMDNPDMVVAIDRIAFRRYVDDLERAEAILGKPVKTVQKSERSERVWARRGKDGLRPKEDGDA